MKIFKTTSLVIVALLIVGILVSVHQAEDRDTLYQVSILSGLLQGDYDGKMTLHDIRAHGDFGIGTYDRLDGEAIELDGVFYQVKADGKVNRASERSKSPFAMATFFDTDAEFPVNQKPDYRSLQEFIDSRLPTKSIPYAVKIEGKFDYIKVRSVPAQNKPYSPFSEVAKQQSVFEFRDIEGTLIGFRMPGYMQGVNVSGYHMHFLSHDKIKGGHVLECALGSGLAKFDDIKTFVMALPSLMILSNLLCSFHSRLISIALIFLQVLPKLKKPKRANKAYLVKKKLT